MTKKKSKDQFKDFKKLKGRCISFMRKDFKKSPAYTEAKKRAFLGDTVYECGQCGAKFYTGTSDKNFQKLKEEKYPDLVRSSLSKAMDMDHQDPIVPYDSSTDEMSLEELMVRIYCHEDNLQYICKACHSEKSKKEATIRKKYRELKKLEE